MSTFQPSDEHSSHDIIRSSQLSNNRPSECARFAPLLTAWFDGEAGEDEITAVREHLCACRPCAATWRGWQHTRFLLRSAPLPLPPVGLLTRILQACRIASRLPAHSPLTARISRRTARNLFTSSSETGPAVSDVSHLPLGGFAWDDEWTPMPPPDLQDAILRRTTGRTSDSASVEMPVAMLLPVPEPTNIFSSRGKANWSLWTRHMAAVAVPAALIWMVMVPETAQAPHDVLTIPSSALPSDAAKSDALKSVRRSVREASSTTRGRSAQIVTRPLSASGKATRSAPIAKGISPSLPVPHVNALNTNDLDSSKATSELIEAQPSIPIDKSAEVWASDRQSSPPEQTISARPQLASLPMRRIGAARRPKISEGYAKRAIGSPSGAVKSSVIANTLDDRAVAQSTITSMHRAEDTVGTDATPTSDVENGESREPAIDMHDALAEAPSWGDSRPDDIRNVVDAYAAALISDETDSEAGEANG